MHYVDGKTCLYITHQLEGLEQMDRIIFMDRGQIVEDGTYEELIVLRGRRILLFIYGKYSIKLNINKSIYYKC